MKEVFPIVPAGNGPLLILTGLTALMLGILLLFVYMVYSSRHARFEVSRGVLRVSGVYGRRIDLGHLQLDRAEIVDLNARRDLQIRWKTTGTGLPGYCAGWFRLRNKQKALVFVTERRRVVYLPTGRGYALLLSPAWPEEFLAALHRARG